MKDDPIIDEIHKFRRHHAKKNNYDLRAMFTDLKDSEKSLRGSIVSREPRRHFKATGS